MLQAGGALAAHTRTQSSDQAGARADSRVYTRAAALAGRGSTLESPAPGRGACAGLPVSGLKSLAKSSVAAESPFPEEPRAGLGRGWVPTRPEVPRCRVPRSPRTPGDREVEWGGRAARRESGARPDLPLGVPARGRPGPSDHAAGSSGTVLGRAQAPRGAERGAPGAHMSLALALGMGPGRRRRQPRAEWGSRRRRRALGLSLPSTSCIAASGAFRKRLALVVKGFLSKAIRRRLAARSPLGHTEAGRPRPRGRAWQRAVPGQRRPARAPSLGVPPPPAGAAARAACGLPEGNLNESNWAGKGGLSPPTRPDLCRQVGRPGAGVPGPTGSQGFASGLKGLEIIQGQPQTGGRVPPWHL